MEVRKTKPQTLRVTAACVAVISVGGQSRSRLFGRDGAV